MQGFFAKSKPLEKKESPKKEIRRSDFEQKFKPYVLKRDAILAPVNWFLQRENDIIVIDDEDKAVKRSRCADIQAASDTSVLHSMDVSGRVTPALIMELWLIHVTSTLADHSSQFPSAVLSRSCSFSREL
jgi:hypothetical protein